MPFLVPGQVNRAGEYNTGRLFTVWTGFYGGVVLKKTVARVSLTRAEATFSTVPNCAGRQPLPARFLPHQSETVQAGHMVQLHHIDECTRLWLFQAATPTSELGD